MNRIRRTAIGIFGLLMLAILSAPQARAQVGKGLVDPNVAAEADLRSCRT